MGHSQPATKIKTDNNTTNRFINGTIKHNNNKIENKAVEMRFDWLKRRSAQLQFNIYWAPGQESFTIFPQTITQLFTTKL